MPLHRAKLHSKTGKVKVIKQQQPKLSSSIVNTVTTADSSSSSSNQQSSESSGSDAERQFMIELYWCIHQLENSLNSGKLNQKQGKKFQNRALFSS